MARRRYLSTNISTDKLVGKLASEYGDFAALLYTWMLPHAEDDCSVESDHDEIMLAIVPAFRKKKRADIDKAIAGMLELGLLLQDDDGYYFPPAAFYHYQTYIKDDKRRPVDSKHRISTKVAGNVEKPSASKKVAENAASVSPPISPPISPSPSVREEQSAPEPDAALRPAIEFHPDVTEDPEPPGESRFVQTYRVKHEATTKVPISGDKLPWARRLEAKYGYELCVEVAEAKGWDKHPKYYQGLAEDLSNGLRTSTDNGSQRGSDNGRLAPDVYAAALYGTGRPPVFVMDPGGANAGEVGEHSAAPESRVVVS